VCSSDLANSNQIINVAIGNTQTSAMGNYVTSTTGSTYSASGAFVMGGYAAGGSYTMSVSGTGNFTSGTGANGLLIQGAVGNANVNVQTSTESAADLASAVNAVSSQTGVSAQGYTSAAFSVTSGTYTFTLSNGSSGSPTNAVNISADVTNGSNGQPDMSSLVTAVNNQAAVTGISASTQTVNGTTQLVLTNSNGNNINISAGVTSAGTLSGAGLASGSTGTLTALGSDGAPLASGAITSKSANVLIQGAVQFESSSSYSIGSGSMIGFSSAATALSGSSVANINVTTAAGAQQAIGILDQAINYLNQQNGSLGAIQNRIQASVSNDQTTATNLQSAQSVVQNANIAQATTSLTQYQILQQAGISTLSTENSLQQSYLKLLP
jgi:flagellin